MSSYESYKSVVSMKAAAIVSCLTGLANAAAINLRGESPLVVEIEQVGNSEVKASITNTGNAGLRLLKAGSILDSAPVEKARVAQGGAYAFLASLSWRIG